MKIRFSLEVFILAVFLPFTALCEESVSKLKVLESMLKLDERIPPFRGSWQVLRQLSPDPVFANSIEKDFEKKIAEASSEDEIAKLERQKASILEGVDETRKIPITVDVSFYSPLRTVIRQVFNYDSGPVGYKYYSSGNGLTYTVDENMPRITIQQTKKGEVFQEAGGGGFPEIGCRNLFDLLTVKSVVEEGGKQVVSGDHADGATVEVVVDLEKGSIERVDVYSGKNGGISFAMTTENAYMDLAGYPISSKVEYSWWNDGELKKREPWKLDKVEAVDSLSDLEKPEFIIPKGYIIYDQTGPRRRKFLSDDLFLEGQ